MPLELDISDLVLGEASEGEDRYLFLLSPATEDFRGAAGYFASRRYFECVDLVSQGYGPTLWLLLMQKARRDGFLGVAPDLSHNSEQAKRMDARLFFDPPPGVEHVENPDAHHPEVYLNQIYFMTGDLVPEEQARRNGALYFAAHSLEAMLPALKAYLLQAKPR
jgi:hypothetical protein